MNLSWYQTLIKPSLTPPPIVFPIAWSILYFLIFLSFLFYIRKIKNLKDFFPLSLFFSGLILNFLWTPVFFKIHDMKLALAIIVLIILLLIPNIILFYKKDKLSGILLIPYLIWLLFAFYLNYQFIKLN